MILDITGEHIRSLNDTDLRTLVAHLCEKELGAHGLSTAAVTAGGNQNAKDGGIDVRVDLPEGTAISGYVPAALTGFQVKAQDMPRAAILAEMAPGGDLRTSIANIASRHGAYVIASSQGSLADSALTERKNAMQEAASHLPSDARLTVEFYDRDRLATWVNQHATLIPWVRAKIGLPLAGWRPFGDWSSSPARVDETYLLDDRVRLLSPSIDNPNGLTAADGVNCLRKLLAEPRGVVRLVGLSGVGKTRLVQALFDNRVGSDSLNPRDAIYADISDSPDPVPLEMASRFVSLKQRAILIIDNCGADLHQKLTTKVCESQSSLSLVTVEYDINDDEPERTNVFKLEAASVELIEKILEARYPHIAVPSRRAIAEFSDGNARIAFALAATAQNGNSLSNLKDKELFKRLFEQSKGPNESLLNAAKACALLYSFDGETRDGDDAELPVLAGLIEISTDQLYASISELIRRKLVQKRGRWRAILPHALAHRLAKAALEDIPLPKIEAAIVNGDSIRMLRSFSRRLGYMHDEPATRELVTKWLTRDGLLSKLGELNFLGEAILINIAPVDPALTLSYIEEAASRVPGFFEDNNLNRATIIRLLRSLAYDAALFDRCVGLLCDFSGYTEKGNNSDSARNVLKSLFYLYLSGTHASAAQRVFFVRKLLNDGSAAMQELGFEVLEAMLECTHFSSHYSFDFGARSRDFGANPKGSEITEWFNHVIGVCREIGMSTQPVGTAVRSALASRFGDIGFRAGMIDELDQIARKFAEDTGWPEGWIGVCTAIRRWKGKAPEELVQKLEKLSKILQPSNLLDLVRSYAFSKEWTALDIADLDEDEEHDPEKARIRIINFCIDLGRQLVNQPSALEALLPEIFSAKTHKTIALGRGIATACESLRESWEYLVERFVDTPESNRGPNLLAGFIEEAARRDARECKSILDSALADPRLHPHLVYLQVHAGITSESLPRILAALNVDTIPTWTYRNLAYGRVHEGLDDQQLVEILQKLSSRPDGLAVAIEILGMRIYPVQHDNTRVSAIVKEIARYLISKARFETKEADHYYQLARLVEVSLDCPKDYPLACNLCTQISDSIATYSISAYHVDEVVRALAKACPSAVLDVLVEGAQVNDSRSLFNNLSEIRPDPLGDVPAEVLVAWAEKKPETRFLSLAHVVRFFVAPEDANSKCWSPAANRIIALAPNVENVLGIFLMRFQPMSWSGSCAEIMASRIPLIQSLTGHARREVAEWSAKTLPAFEARVKQEREKEAAHDRTRDERFE